MIAGTPVYLHYRLRLRSPAIVSTLSAGPSRASTQPFIPGGAIRGALVARLLTSNVSANSEEFRRLILSGEVRFLHAYPELTGERSLPSILSWKSEKTDPTHVFDLAAFSGRIDASMDIEDFENVWPEESLGSVAAPFAAAFASSGTRAIAAPPIESRVHQQRDRTKGRPWTKRCVDTEERHGAIFPFEYLEADQYFRGVIQVMPGATEEIERIERLLRVDAILVGRSRRAGYGGEGEVNFLGQTTREYENVSGSILRDVAGGTFFRALLTSAYVGRHPTSGQLDPSALQLELHSKLGGLATVERTRWAFETIGAFNQKWRLEVPQAQAVASGAVFVLRANADICEHALRAIEHEGIGERRVEGFGRLLFLEHSEDDRTLTLRLPTQISAVKLDAPSGSHEQLRFLEERVVLAAVRSELDQIASVDIAGKAQKLPTGSLLSRLRNLFRAVTDEGTAQSALRNLAAWCGDGDAALKETARKQLENCDVLGGRFVAWLNDLGAAKPGSDGWKTLLKAVGRSSDRLSPIPQEYHLTQTDTVQEHLNAHAVELCVYLVDSVLAALARQNRRTQEESND